MSLTFDILRAHITIIIAWLISDIETVWLSIQHACKYLLYLIYQINNWIPFYDNDYNSYPAT